MQDIQAFGVTLLPLSINHITSTASLPDHHRDPFNRMFVAQALAEVVLLITSDRDIWSYDVETIWN